MVSLRSLGVLADADEQVEELVHIGHVEVAGHHQVAGDPVAEAAARVAVLQAVGADRWHSAGAPEHFAQEGHLRLQPVHIAGGSSGSRVQGGLIALLDATEDLLDGLLVRTALAIDVVAPGQPGPA
jgi:hypothetical protein